MPVNRLLRWDDERIGLRVAVMVPIFVRRFERAFRAEGPVVIPAQGNALGTGGNSYRSSAQRANLSPEEPLARWAGGAGERVPSSPGRCPGLEERPPPWGGKRNKIRNRNSDPKRRHFTSPLLRDGQDVDHCNLKRHVPSATAAGNRRKSSLLPKTRAVKWKPISRRMPP